MQFAWADATVTVKELSFFKENALVQPLAFFLLKQPAAFTMTMPPDYLADIESAIQLRCRCQVSHRESVFVHEKTADNETVWFGDVEVFDLIDCKEAQRCYAWQSFEEGIRVVTILHSRVVDSPHRAVQAAIFSGVQPPMMALTDEATMLKQRMEQAKKALYEAQIKAEDLEGIVQTIRRTSQSISQ